MHPTPPRDRHATATRPPRDRHTDATRPLRDATRRDRCATRRDRYDLKARAATCPPQVPLTLDAFLDDVVSSVQFNTIELEDVIAVLTSFDIGANLTIYLIVIVITVLDAASLVWLGCYRSHRRKLMRRRNGKEYAHEAHELRLKLLAAEHWRRKRDCRTEERRQAAGSRRLSWKGKRCATEVDAEAGAALEKQAQLRSLASMAAAALRAAEVSELSGGVSAPTVPRTDGHDSPGVRWALTRSAVSAGKMAPEAPKPRPSTGHWHRIALLRRWPQQLPGEAVNTADRTRHPSRDGHDCFSVPQTKAETARCDGPRAPSCPEAAAFDDPTDTGRRLHEAYEPCIARIANNPRLVSSVSIGLVVEVLAQVTACAATEVSAEVLMGRPLLSTLPAAAPAEKAGRGDRAPPSPPASPPVIGHVVSPATVTILEKVSPPSTRVGKRQRAWRALDSVKRGVSHVYGKSLFARTVRWIESYGARVARTAQKEHTIIGALSPDDDPDALTPSQLLQAPLPGGSRPCHRRATAASPPRHRRVTAASPPRHRRVTAAGLLVRRYARAPLDRLLSLALVRRGWVGGRRRLRRRVWPDLRSSL